MTAGMINDFTGYLFVALTYNNAQRPGAVINMTINEFKKSKAIIDTDGQKYYKVVVQSHKTSTTYGGGFINFNSNHIRTIVKLYKICQASNPRTFSSSHCVVIGTRQPHKKVWISYKQHLYQIPSKKTSPSLTEYRKVTSQLNVSARVLRVIYNTT